MTRTELLQRDAVDIMARTVWAEARGETIRGMEAVANVIVNRVGVARENNNRYWWGNSIQTVCLKPFQFSCWNENDPNREKLLAVTEKNAVFATCLRIARRAVAGTLRDQTYGATHYHTLSIHPHWAEGQDPTIIIGNHIFYRII